jgi:hypothetical protein
LFAVGELGSHGFPFAQQAKDAYTNGFDWAYPVFCFERGETILVGCFFPPEVGRYLGDNQLSQVRQAVEYGVKVSGCTVHFVDEGTDTGPIIIQRCIPVEEGDDEEILAARILVEEHRILAEAVRLVLEGKVKARGVLVPVLPEIYEPSLAELERLERRRVDTIVHPRLSRKSKKDFFVRQALNACELRCLLRFLQLPNCMLLALLNQKQRTLHQVLNSRPCFLHTQHPQ